MLDNAHLFAPLPFFPALLQPIALLGLATALFCSLRLWQLSKALQTGLPPPGAQQWRADLAWLRALQYFGLIFVVSHCLGVWQPLLSIADGASAAVSASDIGQFRPWLSGLWIAQVLIAYGVIWPIGTFAENRPRRWIVSGSFGALWGFCQALAFLSIWSLVELTDLKRLWVALISFALISAFNGNWHARYWDIYVSPLHNIEAWNVRKVLFCHVPNLALGITHLALYGNVRLFVLLQVIALMLSAIVMRFPHWNYSGRSK